MKPRPLVSIAITTYNHEAFIHEALSSCLDQSYENFEICIADDHSTDRTVAIIEELRAKFPQRTIKLHVQARNLGQYSIAHNVNAAYDLCSGKYLAFLDGDDIMLKDRLREQVAFLEAHPDHVAVTHEAKVFDNDSGKVHVGYFNYLIKGHVTPDLQLRHGNQIHTPTIMFRNLPEFRASYALRYIIDGNFHFHLLQRGPIGHQRLCLTRYRLHGSNITRQTVIARQDLFVGLALAEAASSQFGFSIALGRIDNYVKLIMRGHSAYWRLLLSHSSWMIIWYALSKLKKFFMKRIARVW